MDPKLRHFLASTELLHGLPDDAIRAVGEASKVRRYNTNVTVFEQGAVADALYFVYSGSVEVRRRDGLTGMDFLLAVYGAGKSIGEEGVIIDKPFPVSAVAREECHLVVVPRAEMRRLISAYASVAAASAQIMARRTNRFIAEKGVRFIKLSSLDVDPEVVGILPERLITEHQVVPVAQRGGTLTVAMVDPYDLVATDAVRRAAPGMYVEPAGVSAGEFERFMRLHTAELTSVAVKESNVLPPLPKRTHSIRFMQEGQDNVAEAERRSEVVGEQVLQVLDTILGDALFLDASDIHVEPGPEAMTVRYRIDGKLMQRPDEVPMRFHMAMINRIKALASMDITERRKPQDGRLGIAHNQREVSLRISTVPTRFGENLVMRVLDKSTSLMSFDRIVLVPSVRDMIRGLIFAHHGIVLVTGPTGSGKTTTMYSAILERKDEGVNIVTIEDPVEYTIPGITQVQYNEAIGLTYAEAVRAFLRQDTDIMLIGETRDARTAHNAIQAALSGHLVVSSLHTNSALATVYRLQEMGIEPFLIANAISGVIAQRLVRTICSECKEPFSHNAALVERIFGSGDAPQLYRGVGCTRCNGTGFRGRTAVLEVMQMTEELRTAIAGAAAMSELRRIALAAGMVPFRNYAKFLLGRGLTTPQEVLRTLAIDDEGWTAGEHTFPCSECGASNAASNAFCEECGAALSRTED